ncbi:MAG: hypothetical protein ACNI25_04360 [Halarcobacter sp.]
MTEKPDYFARTTAVISLVFAIVAMLVSYYQQESAQQVQKEQFEVLQKEELIVKVNPYIDGFIRLTNYNLGHLGHVVQIPWKIIISNTGNQKLSITDCFVTRGDSPESIQYSGIYGGIIDQKSKTIEFPLMLDPGESRIVYIFVGITVPSLVYQTLFSLDKNTTLTDRLAMKALGKQRIDYYGNPVEYEEFEGGLFHFVVKDTKKAQRFWIKFTTGRGNIYYGTGMAYKSI